jgi:Leucine-rich repeat (LRR) protein
MPYNLIKKVPGGIGKLTKLQKLDLTGNEISKDWMSDQKYFQTIILNSNIST